MSSTHEKAPQKVNGSMPSLQDEQLYHNLAPLTRPSGGLPWPTSLPSYFGAIIKAPVWRPFCVWVVQIGRDTNQCVVPSQTLGFRNILSCWFFPLVQEQVHAARLSNEGLVS